jgi:hypothetical protein
VEALSGWLLEELSAMRHSSGASLARIYGPLGVEGRGGAIAMNFLSRDGSPIDHRRIEAEANARGISRDELSACFTSPAHRSRLTIDDFRDCIDGKSTGAARVFSGNRERFLGRARIPRLREGLPGPVGRRRRRLVLNGTIALGPVPAYPPARFGASPGISRGGRSGGHK